MTKSLLITESALKVGAALLGLLALGAVGGVASHGWDQQLICSAGALQASGLSPYVQATLTDLTGSALSIPYLPAWLPPLSVGCGWDSSFFQMTLLAALGVVLSRFRFSVSVWEQVVLLTAGFAGAAWNFRSGNFALFELLGVCLSLLILRFGGFHTLLAGGVLGLIASLKLLPFSYLGVPLLLWVLKHPEWGVSELPQKKTLLLRFLAGALIGGTLPWILSWGLWDSQFGEYWTLNWNAPRQDGVHAAWTEWNSDHNTPTPFLVLMDALPREWTLAIGRGRFVLTLALMGGVLIPMTRWLIRSKATLPVSIASLSMALFFLMPRIKPYSFIHLILPTLIVLDSVGSAKKSRELSGFWLFSSVLPILGLLSLPLWKGLTHPWLLRWALDNLQWISSGLACFFLLRTASARWGLQQDSTKA